MGPIITGADESSLVSCLTFFARENFYTLLRNFTGFVNTFTAACSINGTHILYPHVLTMGHGFFQLYHISCISLR